MFQNNNVFMWPTNMAAYDPLEKQGCTVSVSTALPSEDWNSLRDSQGEREKETEKETETEIVLNRNSTSFEDGFM